MSPDLGKGTGVGMLTSAWPSHQFTPCTGNSYREEAQSGANPPSPGQSGIRDGYVPLYSMYSEIGEEEDNRLFERWRKDADVTLIFVSPHVDIYSAASMNGTPDRFIFCRCCRAAYGDGSGLEAKLSRYFGVLSPEYVSDSCPSERIPPLYPLYHCETT